VAQFLTEMLVWHSAGYGVTPSLPAEGQPRASSRQLRGSGYSLVTPMRGSLLQQPLLMVGGFAPAKVSIICAAL
jgi:hypothetical protein